MKTRFKASRLASIVVLGLVLLQQILYAAPFPDYVPIYPDTNQFNFPANRQLSLKGGTTGYLPYWDGTKYPDSPLFRVDSQTVGVDRLDSGTLVVTNLAGGGVLIALAGGSVTNLAASGNPNQFLNGNLAWAVPSGGGGGGGDSLWTNNIAGQLAPIDPLVPVQVGGTFTVSISSTNFLTIDDSGEGMQLNNAWWPGSELLNIQGINGTETTLGTLRVLEDTSLTIGITGDTQPVAGALFNANYHIANGSSDVHPRAIKATVTDSNAGLGHTGAESDALDLENALGAFGGSSPLINGSFKTGLRAVSDYFGDSAGGHAAGLFGIAQGNITNLYGVVGIGWNYLPESLAIGVVGSSVGVESLSGVNIGGYFQITTGDDGDIDSTLPAYQSTVILADNLGTGLPLTIWQSNRVEVARIDATGALSVGDPLGNRAYIAANAADGSTPYTFDTAIAHTSGYIGEWRNNGTNLLSLDYNGSLLLGIDTSHGSQLFYADSARTATTWFGQDGSSVNIAAGSGNISLTMSGVGGATGATFQPTVSDATTAYVFDTTVAHTTGSVLEVSDLGTNLFKVNPTSIQFSDRIKLLIPRDSSGSDFQAQLRGGVYDPISFDVGNSDFTITSTYFNFQNSVQTNLASARSHPVLVNSIGVASDGLQAWSPALSWHGSGWSTGLSASRGVLFDSAIEPIQGSEATGMLRWYGTISTNTTKEVFGISSEGPVKLASVTKAQKTALLNLENGMMVYQTDNTPGFRGYINGTWFILSTAADP